MLKPSASRIFFALFGAFCVILIAALFSGATGKICNESQSGQEQCAAYNLALFILIRIREFLHSVENIITALATIAIAVFTWTLYKSSEKMWGVTKIAAEAAQLSAAVAERTLTDLERPWLFLDAQTVRRLNSPGPAVPIPNDWVIKLHWKNVGRTPALIDACEFEIAPRSTLPEWPIYTGKALLTCPATVATSEEFETNEVGPALRSNEELVVFGRMIYRDLGNRRHETGFAICVSPHMPASMAHPNKNYFYLT